MPPVNRSYFILHLSPWTPSVRPAPDAFQPLTKGVGMAYAKITFEHPEIGTVRVDCKLIRTVVGHVEISAMTGKDGRRSGSAGPIK
jgi:hypothetical protein